MRERTRTDKLALMLSAIPLLGMAVVYPSILRWDRYNERAQHLSDQHVPESWDRRIYEYRRRLEVANVGHVIGILVMVFVFDVPLPW